VVVTAERPLERTADVLVTPTARRLHLLSLVLTGAYVLWTARSVPFYWDDWAFVSALGADPSWSWAIAPHNEHWVVLPKLGYWLVDAIFGTGAAFPYVALTVVLHVVLAHLLWRLAIRSGANDWLATIAAGGFVVFAAGIENVLFAVQMSLVGSAVLGTLGVLELARPGARPRAPIVVVTTCLSVMTFGVSVVFLAVSAIYLVSQRRWRHLGWLVPAMALFGGYLLVFHSQAAGPPRGSADWATLALYVPTGIGLSFSAVAPWRPPNEVVNPVISPLIGMVALASLSVLGGAVMAAAGVRRWRPAPVAWAYLAGCPLAWLVVAVSRVQFGLGTVMYSRYIYVGTVFLLPFLVTFASKLVQGSRWQFNAAATVFVVLAIANVHAWSGTSAAWVSFAQGRARVLLAGQQLLNEHKTLARNIGSTPHFAFLSPEALRALDLGSVPRPVTESDRLTASLVGQTLIRPITVDEPNCGVGTSELSIPRAAPNVIRISRPGTWELVLRDPETGVSSSPWPRQFAAGFYELRSLDPSGTLILVDRFGRPVFAEC